MVIFDRLRISDDGKTLYVDAHVNTAPYYEDVYLDKITICTEEHISETLPTSYSSHFIYQDNIAGENGEDTKTLSLVLDLASFSAAYINQTSEGTWKDETKPWATEDLTDGTLSSHIIFVYITCKGTPAADTPCGMDTTTTLGATLDYSKIYNNAMGYIKELADTCNISSGFQDFLLRYNMFNIAFKSGHIIPAIKMWKSIMGDVITGTNVRAKCGCHG